MASEMRNPLSAIIQCGDWIGTSLSEFGGESQNVTIPRELVDGYVDAAQRLYFVLNIRSELSMISLLSQNWTPTFYSLPQSKFNLYQ
jgi:hypothetical protein